jgi:sugar/nucleoside kinase (ribokinase family)
MLKVDKIDNRPISERLVEKVKEAISSQKNIDAVVFSDFRHGIFNRHTIPILADAIPKGVLRVADSQVASRWGNILEFQHFDLLTPNEREARFALGDQDSVIRPLAYELYRKASCKTLILKCGSRGILTYRKDSPDDMRAFFALDSFVDRLVDPVGAGDALLAYSTLALASTRSPVIASILGSMAAAVACERDGNVPITSVDINKKLDAVEKQVTFQ